MCILFRTILDKTIFSPIFPIFLFRNNRNCDSELKIAEKVRNHSTARYPCTYDTPIEVVKMFSLVSQFPIFGNGKKSDKARPRLERPLEPVDIQRFQFSPKNGKLILHWDLSSGMRNFLHFFQVGDGLI